MIKYTEAELKDACLARADYEIQVSMIKDLVALPFEKWWAVYKMKPLIFKPAKKKIIDLEPLIESGIDCEFGDDGEAWTSINTLDCTTNGKYPYENQLDQYGYCRPRMNYKMFNNGGECPLPEGFEVKLYWRDSSEYYIDSDYIDLRWDDTGRSGDIIAYEILGLADGYAYPWEQAECDEGAHQ